MTAKSLLSEYIQEAPESFELIKSLEKKWNLKLLKKINKDSNDINFYSWMAEVRFGLFFDTICERMKYDFRIDRKTPDWTIWFNGQKIIAEVLRINTSEDEFLEKIKRGREMRKFQRENPGVTIIEGSEAKIMSSAFFYGHQDKLSKKSVTYRDIILKHKLPLIICMETSVGTYVGDLDVFDFLIGNTKKGFYYSDEEFGKNVTGVLLRDYFGKLVYFPNELAENKLNDDNFKFFKSLHYQPV